MSVKKSSIFRISKNYSDLITYVAHAYLQFISGRILTPSA